MVWVAVYVMFILQMLGNLQNAGTHGAQHSGYGPPKIDRFIRIHLRVHYETSSYTTDIYQSRRPIPDGIHRHESVCAKRPTLFFDLREPDS